jgi:Chromo (CHRromatin Organisation MOdifier) domain
LKFWQQLHSACGTSLKMLTPFHPQTDGQSETANRVVIAMLRSYIRTKQTNWDVVLPLVQHAYNDSVHSSTGLTPSFFDMGRHRRTPILLANPKAQVTDAVTGRVHSVAYTLVNNQQVLAEARKHLLLAHQKQKFQADKKRGDAAFAEGDSVMLDTEHLNLKWHGSCRKLRPKHMGPFRIVAMKGPNAAELELPATMKCHKVQNISKLRLYVDESARFPGRPQPPPPTIFADGHVEYEVEEILGQRGKGVGVQFLVKWTGYPVHDSEWTHVI